MANSKTVQAIKALATAEAMGDIVAAVGDIPTKGRDKALDRAIFQATERVIAKTVPTQ